MFKNRDEIKKLMKKLENIAVKTYGMGGEKPDKKLLNEAYGDLIELRKLLKDYK